MNTPILPPAGDPATPPTPAQARAEQALERWRAAQSAADECDPVPSREALAAIDAATAELRAARLALLVDEDASMDEPTRAAVTANRADLQAESDTAHAAAETRREEAARAREQRRDEIEALAVDGVVAAAHAAGRGVHLAGDEDDLADDILLLAGDANDEDQALALLAGNIIRGGHDGYDASVSRSLFRRAGVSLDAARETAGRLVAEAKRLHAVGRRAPLTASEAEAMAKLCAGDPTAIAARLPASVQRAAAALAAGPAPKAAEVKPVTETTSPEPDPGMLPKDLLDVPGLVGEWAQYALDSAYRPQPELALGAAIIGSGALIGSRLTSAASARVRAALYGIGLGITSHGKNAGREAVSEVLNAADAGDLVGPEDLASDSGFVSALVQQPKLLFQIDEVGFLLAAVGAPDAAPHLRGIAANMLRLFTSCHTMWKGKAYADADRNPTIDQPHACLWLTGVPDKFWNAMTRDAIDDGLLGRCLLFQCLPKPPPRRTPLVDAPPSSLVERVRRWHRDTPTGLAKIHPTAQAVPCDDGARRLLAAEFERLNDLEATTGWAQRAGAPLHGRVAEIGHRLALIYAWSRDQDHPVIDAMAMLWGLGLARFSAERLAYHAERRLPVSGSGHEKELLRVLELVRRAGSGGVPRGVLIRQVRLPSRRLDEVLDALQQGGEVFENCDGRATRYTAT